jgi:GNAT superfamily N-acetyltransferase
VIRLLEPADVDVVSDVLGLARLYQGTGFYLVAWDGDEPLGHLHLALSDPPELQDVEVKASVRGKGVATALISAAEAWCEMTHRREVCVTVSVDNDVARGLYEKLGYADAGLPPRRVTGTVDLRTGPLEVDDTLVTLSKTLAPN